MWEAGRPSGGFREGKEWMRASCILHPAEATMPMEGPQTRPAPLLTVGLWSATKQEYNKQEAGRGLSSSEMIRKEKRKCRTRKGRPEKNALPFPS